MKRYPMSTKRQVVEFAKNNTVAKASKNFKIPRPTIYTWLDKPYPKPIARKAQRKAPVPSQGMSKRDLERIIIRLVDKYL